MLQSGLVVAAVAPFVPVALVAPFVPEARAVELVALEPLSDVALLVVWASTGVAPMTAAAMRLRVKGMRFILLILLESIEKRHALLGTGGVRGGCARVADCGVG